MSFATTITQPETPAQMTGELTGQALVNAVNALRADGTFGGENELSIPSTLLVECEALPTEQREIGLTFNAVITTGGQIRESRRTTRKSKATGQDVPTRYLVCGYSIKNPAGIEANPNGRKALAPSTDDATLLKIQPGTPAKFRVFWDANRQIPNQSTKGAWSSTLTV